MEIIGVVIFIIAGFIVLNRDWIKYMWTEYIINKNKHENEY